MGLIGQLHDHLKPRPLLSCFSIIFFFLMNLPEAPVPILSFMAHEMGSSSCHHICPPTVLIFPVCESVVKEKGHVLPLRT